MAALIKAYSDLELHENTLDEKEWFGPQGEKIVFGKSWGVSKEFRRTISSFCKVRVRIERDDGPLRREIGREQDEGKGPDKPLPILWMS